MNTIVWKLQALPETYLERVVREPLDFKIDVKLFNNQHTMSLLKTHSVHISFACLKQRTYETAIDKSSTTKDKEINEKSKWEASLSIKLVGTRINGIK